MKLPPLDVTGILRRYGLRPNKKLGQNFLVDERYLQKVVDAADISPQNDVLEIGPGLGSLTRLLALSSRRVVAVELDDRLLAPLSEVLAPYKNVEIVQGDILEISPGALMRSPDYVVVANIPYYITSAVIRHLLESRFRPSTITLTVQEEVAERITALPGDLSLLALSVQVYGHPEIVARIPAGAFHPQPQVDSAVVKVKLYPEPRIPPERLDTFFRLAKAGFGQKRKNLRNALSGGTHWDKDRAVQALEAAGLDPRSRAQALTMEDWMNLTLAAEEIDAQG